MTGSLTPDTIYKLSFLLFLKWNNKLLRDQARTRPGLGQINILMPTALTKWPGQRNFTAEWLSEETPGLIRSTFYFHLRGQVEQVIWIRVGETKQGWDHSLYLSTNQSWENAWEQYCPEHILASLGNFLEEASERVFSDLREGAPLRVTASGLWRNLYGF